MCSKQQTHIGFDFLLHHWISCSRECCTIQEFTWCLPAPAPRTAEVSFTSFPSCISTTHFLSDTNKTQLWVSHAYATCSSAGEPALNTPSATFPWRWVTENSWADHTIKTNPNLPQCACKKITAWNPPQHPNPSPSHTAAAFSLQIWPNWQNLALVTTKEKQHNALFLQQKKEKGKGF